MVIKERHKDPYRAFFTVDEVLGEYMATLLDLKNNDTVLEPAAGEGHLIDAVYSILPQIDITAYELNPNYAAILRNKYGHYSQLKIREQDTLFCPDLDLKETFGPKFSKILANPPYGGWQDYDRRAFLKKRFAGFYVRETYTLFLLRSLRLLAQDGKLVFIIPDTFLYLHLHQAIRQYLLTHYSIESLDILPSSCFPNLSFGYAKLCIICVSGIVSQTEQWIKIRKVNSIQQLKQQNDLSNIFSIQQEKLLKNPNFTIPLSSQQVKLNQVSQQKLTMGDIANCVTGFYSGADRHFLRKASPNLKRANQYEVVNWDKVEPFPFSQQGILEGLESPQCFIPLLKGGGYHFLKPIQWYVDWSKTAVNYYKTNQKSRFQNATYYFKRGIGFPMVTSTKPTAALIYEALFDQSIVGIFPKEDVSLEFLLAYCNSWLFWDCLKAINPSANNSAKYILKTPIILPTLKTQNTITQQTQELLYLKQENDPTAEQLQAEILNSINALL